MILRFLPSFKILVPALLIAFAGLLSFSYLYYTLPRTAEAIEKRYVQNLFRNMSRLQGTLEYLIRKQDWEGVRREVAVIASDPENRLVLVLDENHTIVASTRRGWLNEQVERVFPPFNMETASVTKQQQRAQVKLASNKQSLFGYTSVNLGARENELRPSRTGVLFFQTDLAHAKGQARAQLLNQSLYWVGHVSALALILGVVFHLLLTRRAGKLVNAAEAFARGDLEVRSQLSGSDEIARLSAAFDAMAKEIGITQERLTRDIAERKRVESSLKESELRLQQILNNAISPIYVKDIEGRFLFVNQYSVKLLKLPREEIIGKTSHDLFPKKSADEFRNNDLCVLKKQAPIEFEETIPFEDGTHTYVSIKFPLFTAQGKPYSICGISTDISSRIRTERVLRTAALGVSEASGEVVFEILVRHLATALDVDFAFIGLLSIPDQIHTIAMWAHGEIVENITYNLAGSPCENVVGQKFRYYPEAIQRRFPNDLLLVELGVQGYSALPLFDSSSSAVGLLAVLDRKPLKDMHLTESILKIFAARAVGELERERTQAQRLELETQLRQAQKMEAIGQLTGGIAHDFNNILTSIMGNTDLALEASANEHHPKLKKYLKNVHRSGERARDLIRQMFTFSRGQRGEPRVLSLAPLVNDMVKLMSSTLQSSIELHIEISGETNSVKLDPVQVEQVLMNLCINARDAMDGMGTITIDLKNRIHSSAVCTSCRHTFEGEFVELTVKDSGTGIDAETLDRMFEPFYTTKETGKGTGMGLSTVHGIVHEHGGHIIVETTPGKGAAFHIAFPAVLEQPDGQLFDKEKRPCASASHENVVASVLVIDDEELVAEFMGDLLVSRGFQATVLTDAIEAREQFFLKPETYDLIIIDQTMPKITGTELAMSFLHRRPNIPIILYTGHSDMINDEQINQQGIHGYLKKPVEIDRLMEMIGNILDKSQIKQEVLQ